MSIFSSFFVSKLHAQGCSDAGFCTMQHMSVDGEISKDSIVSKNDLTLGFATGVGDDYNFINNPYITFSRDLTDRFSVSSKLVSSFIFGEKGTVIGLGDVYVSSAYKVLEKEKLQTTILGGFKFPLSNSNILSNGKALPLSYQTSLATIDAILGVNVSITHFDFSAGAQIPLSQNNKNTFFANGDDTLHFASTNQFLRKPDLLLRGTYHRFSKNKSWKYSGGLLGIYHISNDTYVDALGNRKDIDNSTGLTLNVVLAAHHYLKNNRYFTISLGAPVVVREIRPDGLTRGFVATFEYHFKF